MAEEVLEKSGIKDILKFEIVSKCDEILSITYPSSERAVQNSCCAAAAATHL
jgi:hypothetical protein